MATVVYRACRRTDLIEGVWSFFNYGLANYRGSNVNATFTQNGYNTHGIATTADPVVAFMYACMQADGGHDIAVFAICVEDEVARAGSVKLQAISNGVARNTACWQSVDAQNEVVLPSVKRSDILGFYSVRTRSGFYDLGDWTDVEGDTQLKKLTRNLIKSSVTDFARRYGGLVSQQIHQKEIDRMMGH
ncbi:MAG: hypothetical protein IBX56_14880 [Methylomicrobium sp.]|nr:hypothetical protein [Methylomicrobium sp.]